MAVRGRAVLSLWWMALIFEWNSTDCLFTATVHYLIGRLNELDQRLSSLFRWPILKKWPTGETFYLKPIFCEGRFGRTVTSPELKSLRLWGYLVHVWCSYGIRWLLLHSQGGCALTSHQNSLFFVAPSMLAWMRLDWMTGRGTLWVMSLMAAALGNQCYSKKAVCAESGKKEP